MISRLRRASALAVLLFTSGLVTLACQKVPLLAPTGSTITITSSATALPTGGTADIIAQVIEAAGTPPHEGTHITFTTNLGTIQPSEAETDIAGRVVVKFVAGNTSGTATIIALSGGVAVAAANAVKIQVGAAAVGSVSLSASPATLSSTGGTTTITATVADTSGNTLSSVPVTFAIDTATGSSGAGSLSATVVNTDANGRAQTTLTTNRTTIVSATAGIGAASGTPATGGAQTGKVTVTVNTTAGITLGAPTPSPATVGQTVTMTLTAGTSTTASAIVRTSVDWGDGRTQSYTGLPAAISHTFTGQGSYLVLVTGVDALGDTSTTSAAITVNPRAGLVVTVSASANPTPNTVTTFTIGATPSTGNAITSLTIDFGDGTRGTINGNATTVQHVFTTSGTYVVTVIATDSSGSTGSASTVIVVGSAGAAASFTVSPTGGPASTTFQFNASDSSSPSGISSYVWDYGDGNTDSGVSVSHKYAVTGTTVTYTVRLTVTDGALRTATTTKQVTVTP